MHPRLALLPLFTVLALCLLPEGLLQGADLGLWGNPQWRSLAYGWFGFWPGLLYDWRPNYALQPLAMFVTYGFLHVGLLHLVLNMITLWSLGRAVTERAGPGGFAWVYGAALLGGAMGFGLLTNTTVPMVGASGALFGLMGAVLVWAVLDRRRDGLTLWPVAQALAWLLALNLGLWLVAGTLLAWQTHLGGFVTGAVAALLLDWARGNNA
jgi:rhomboid protease GluP